RVDRGELRRELLLGLQVDRVHVVREADLLEHDGGLAAVGRRPGVKIDHRVPPPAVKASRWKSSRNCWPNEESGLTPGRGPWDTPERAWGRYPWSRRLQRSST